MPAVLTLLTIFSVSAVGGFLLLIWTHGRACYRKEEHPETSLGEHWWEEIDDLKFKFFLNSATLFGTYQMRAPKSPRKQLYTEFKGLKIYVDTLPRGLCDTTFRFLFWWTEAVTAVVYFVEQHFGKYFPSTKRGDRDGLIVPAGNSNQS